MLYFIATPIGNLNDISLRSIDLLKNTNYIFAEDTRNTKKLLDFLDIKKKVQSFHEHNEKDITPKILSILKDKSDVVIVSDAGTPAISDPGYYLLTQCIKNEITFTALPGPSSVINALLLSGMPPSSFLFLGFIPKKGKPKHNFLESIAKTQHTTILFETARRIENTISILNSLYPQGIDMAICREMTKIHEEVIRGSSTQLAKLIKLNKLTLKGEMVLVLRFSDSKKGFEIDESIMKAFLDKLPPKDAAKLLSLVTKESKREIYKQLLDL